MSPDRETAAATKQVSTEAKQKQAKAEPFAFADFTWLTGNARTKESPMDTKFFTPEIRADVDYIYDFNHPKTTRSADRVKFSGPMKFR